MNAMMQLIHYFGLVCFCASLLIRVLPAPQEISWKPYAIFYEVVHKASLNLPSPTPGGGDANTPQ